MIEGALFIGTVIVAVTQFVKLVTPEWFSGAYTIVVAVAVGILIALVDVSIGVADITVAQGILVALGSSGVVTTAEKIG
jgi:hypothetical protein